MRSLASTRSALGICAVAMLAGCGGGSGTPLNPSPARNTAERAHVRSAYSVLYRFKNETKDGTNPGAGLLNVNGTLYGTTTYGGAHCEASSRGGCGTVFEVTTSGTETVLHSFGSSGDGRYPGAGLVNVQGTLYGTTYDGGANCGSTGGCGTVFTITPSGTETVLHSFGSGSDGSNPGAGLLNVKGTLYGTTANGGANCPCGTVFSITPSGTETVLHSFGSAGDGSGPLAGLLNVKGTLYGTTANGGANCLDGPNGAIRPAAAICGTVFAITTSGKETVLYSFKGGQKDGAVPEAGLINVNGTLYGTTSENGKGRCESTFDGCGTVFSVTTSGKETTLHTFGSGSDGLTPLAGLLNVKGKLYGTTQYGGAHLNSGTVFSITTSGAERVLHSFGGSPDGARPFAGLINVKGTLYGTTKEGGNYCHGGDVGCGTVFSLSP